MSTVPPLKVYGGWQRRSPRLGKRKGNPHPSKRWRCVACGRFRTTTNQKPHCRKCDRRMDPVKA